MLVFSLHLVFYFYIYKKKVCAIISFGDNLTKQYLLVVFKIEAVNSVVLIKVYCNILQNNLNSCGYLQSKVRIIALLERSILR